MLTEIRRVEGDLKDNCTLVNSLDKHTDKIQTDVRKQIQDIKISVLELGEKIDNQSLEIRVGDKVISDSMLEKVAFLKQQMTAFASKEDIGSIIRRMTVFMTKEDCEHFEKRLCPILDECENALTLYSKEHNQMKEMINRFDMVISDKVNKKEWGF